MIEVRREAEIKEIPSLNVKVEEFLCNLLTDDSDSIYIFGISEESGIPIYISTNSEKIKESGLDYTLFIYKLPEFTVESDTTIVMLQDSYYDAWVTPMFELTRDKYYKISTTGTYNINLRK